jgi:hypothetical protein
MNDPIVSAPLSVSAVVAVVIFPVLTELGPAIDAVKDPFGWTGSACAVAANANRASGPNVLKANVRISPSADRVSQRLTYSDPASYPTRNRHAEDMISRQNNRLTRLYVARWLHNVKISDTDKRDPTRSAPPDAFVLRGLLTFGARSACKKIRHLR